jgi:hypothetical protein
MQQVTEKQLVLSDQLANPTRMVQIAMALKSVPYDDIVFVQYPTRYQGSGSEQVVLPVTDAANVLFDALRDNKAIRLTGSASQVYNGPEVQGNAPQPAATPAPTASGSPAATTAPTPDAGAVELPTSIAGTTAAQVTCTRPQQ